MKVFYFITKSESGGAQSVVAELVRGHAARGDECVIMTSGNGWLKEQVERAGYHYQENPFLVNTMNPIILLRAALVYRRAVRAAQPDIVACHSSVAGFLGRIASPYPQRTVYTAHGWGCTPAVPFFRRITVLIAERVAALRCARIICVSQFDADFAIRMHIAPRKKIVAVHNGVSGIPRVVPSEDTKVTFVFPARFAAPKLQSLLIPSIQLLTASERAQIAVVCIGDGPNLGAIQSAVTNEGLDQIIAFTGGLSREETLIRMSQAHALIMLSEREGLPMSIIEAIHIGLPVIASNVGGVAEIIGTDAGILVSSNPADIAEAIRVLLQPVRRKEMANAAYARKEQFSATQMCTKVSGEYENVIADQ